MFGHQYQYEQIRKAVILFGTLFNDIWITRPDNSEFKIPISYGPQEKFLARIQQDTSLDRPAAITLPRIGFEMTSFQYDGSRKQPTLIKNASRPAAASTSANTVGTQYMWVPYNIGFQLTVMSKTAEDATKIVEQILPFFRPHWVVRAKINEPFITGFNIPVVLNTVEQSDSYDDSFVERRAVVWELNFTMKTYLFGPASTTKIIKIVDVNFIIPGSAEDLSNTSALQLYTETENIDLRPGLTANGEPTANQALSIPVANISIDDDYGFAAVISTVEDLD